MRGIFAALILMFSMQALAQKAFTVINDKQLHQPVYTGMVTFDDLNNEKAFDWLKKGDENYMPDKNAVSFLQANLSNYTIIVFLGTWCGDTHNLLPKFEKVLQQIGYSESKLTMYALDMEKKGADAQKGQYNISRVPTFIILKNGKEIGRVTESVKKSIESDLTAILQSDKGLPLHQ
jgi:thiol-disulfide isomerase/thioredoxin